MRIKLYKMRLVGQISLNQNTPYVECFFVTRGEERVKIERFNFMQKLFAKPMILDEKVFFDDCDYPTVKQYKKEKKRRDNLYYTKVDEELSRMGK